MSKFEILSDWEADIGSEDSIYEVARKAAPLIGGKWENRIILLSLVCIAIIVLVCGFCFPRLISPAADQLKFCNSFASLTLGYYSSMLGFITAAFAIVLGLFDKSIFVSLASVRKNGRSVSEFKFMFFAFIYALFVFGILLTISLLIWVMSYPDSVFSLMLSVDNISCAFLYVNAVLVVGFLYSILQVKTLIWNVYQIVIADIILTARKAK